MIKKLKHIIMGWAKRYGWLPSSEAEIKLSELRVKTCQVCPFSKTSKALDFIDGEGLFVNKLYCTQCGCPCKQKSLIVAENCPVGRW